MKLLLIDTCGTTGTIALADSGDLLATASLPGRTASERLVLTIKELAARTHTPLGSLSAIVVVHGPGSFTGVRVGVSAAKGLGEALHLPLVAISRLAVLGHLANVPAAIPIQALLDAGRGEFYSGLYLDDVRIGESLITRDELFAEQAAGSPVAIAVCEPAVAKSIEELSPISFAEPTAADALPLALRRIARQDFDDPATLDANYLRRTDAEIFAKPTSAKSVAGIPAAR